MRTLNRLTLALPLALAACSAGTQPGKVAGPGAAAGPQGKEPVAVAAPDGDARPESSQWLGVAGESAALMPGSQETFLGVWVDVPNRAGAHAPLDRKSTRLNSSHVKRSRMPSSA